MAAAFLAAGPAPASAAATAPVRSGGSTTAPAVITRITRSEAEWRSLLTAEQYRVLRQKGTERAFSGRYWNHEAVGTYTCAGCGLELFSSRAKYDSGTGWPSYFEPIAAGHVREVADTSLGMVRTEIVCARCDGHIGHVFEDGPRPTGLRYCMNSAALSFVPARGESREAPSSAPGAAGASTVPAAGSGGKR